MIDGRETESIEHDADVATTIMDLVRYFDDYTRGAGPSMMFAKDITDHTEHIQDNRVKATRDTAVDPAPAGYVRLPGIF